MIPTSVVRALRDPAPTAADFTATKFSPADSKAWFVAHFLRFVSADFPKHHFVQRFYIRLSATFGHISHYDSAGFFQEFFTSTAGKIEFLEYTLSAPCYGQPNVTWSDAERFIVRRLRETDVLELYRTLAHADERARDRAELARLTAKYSHEPMGQNALRTVTTAIATPIIPNRARPNHAANDRQPAQLTLAIG